MLYSSSGDGNKNKGMRGGGVGSDYCWAKRTDPALDLASDSYSDSNVTL